MLKIILPLLMAVSASAGTYSTNLLLYKPATGDTNYVTPFATGMDTLDAAIADKRINKTAVFASSLTVVGPFTVQSSATVTGSAFSVGGSTMAVIGGNVGIGTTTPSSKLHVSSGSITVNGTGAGIYNAGSSTAAYFYGDGSNITGQANNLRVSTATYLATAPGTCVAGQFITGLAADGTKTCGTPAGAGDVVLASTQTFTGSNTFTATGAGGTAISSATITSLTTGALKVRAYVNTNQADIANGSYTKVALNAQTYGINGAWDTTNSRVVIPSTGIYHISAQVYVYDVLTQGTSVDLVVRKNGVATDLLHDRRNVVVTNTAVIPQVNGDLYLAKDDYLELYALSNTTGSDVYNLPEYSYFSIYGVP